MNEAQLDLLQQTLAGISAQLAGLHASVDVGQRLIAQMRAGGSSRLRAEDLRGRMSGNNVLHYGDPDPAEMIEHLETISGGAAPIPASGGDTPPSPKE